MEVSKKRSMLTRRIMPKERSDSKKWLSFMVCKEFLQVPIEIKMKLAKAIEESETMGVIYADWKLSNYQIWLFLPCHRSNIPSSLPWVFFKPVSNPNHHIFGDIEKKQSYCIETGESSLELLHSKEGWLLYTAPYSVGRNNKTLNSTAEKMNIGWTILGLVNFSTGSRLDLPLLAIDRKNKDHGAFTTISNNKSGASRPDQVVYVSGSAGKLRIFLARPGDKGWKNYIFKCSVPSTMLLCGTKLYGFCTATVLVFELANCTLRRYSLLNQMNLSGTNHYKYLECEGRVVMTGSPLIFLNSDSRNSIPFYKLEISGKMVKWVELRDDELDGRIWFFSRLQSFCVKVAGSGRKVCWFQPKPLLDEKKRVCDVAFSVRCCDMNSGTQIRLTCDYFLCHESSSSSLLSVPYWIDMSYRRNNGIADDKLLSFPDH